MTKQETLDAISVLTNTIGVLNGINKTKERDAAVEKLGVLISLL